MSSPQSWLSSYAYGGYSEKISRISALEIWQPYGLSGSFPDTWQPYTLNRPIYRRRPCEWRYLQLEKIQNGSLPTSWKMSNGHISATGHAIHFAFGSIVGLSGRQIECLYFRLDQIQDRGQPSCIILYGYISETVHPIPFLFGSNAKVQEKIMREE